MNRRSSFGETCAWLDALYGKCSESDGHLVIIAPSRNHILNVFTLGSCERLVAAARVMQDHPGCYVKINPMDYRAMYARAKQSGKTIVGNQSEVKTIVSLHLDVDAGKSAKYPSRKVALQALDAMPHRPTMVINSNGQSGGFHAYWLLRRPMRKTKEWPAIVKGWHRGLKEMLGGKLDSTFNVDRILRCVGVPRKDGGTVECHACDFSRLYKMEDFA